MDELFGPITATSIAAILSIVIGVIKAHWELDGKKALLLSAGVSFLFYIPFYLIWFWGSIPVSQLIYSSIFYAISGFLLACGFYSASKTILRG